MSPLFMAFFCLSGTTILPYPAVRPACPPGVLHADRADAGIEVVLLPVALEADGLHGARQEIFKPGLPKKPEESGDEICLSFII